MALIQVQGARARRIAFLLGILIAPGFGGAQPVASVNWRREFERARLLADAGSLRHGLEATGKRLPV